MSFAIRMGDQDLSAFSKHWGWFLIWGIALEILGVMAISYAALTTLLSVIFLGVLISIGGVLIVIDTFTFWWRHWRGFFLHLLIGALYLFVGYMLIYGPIWASISITLMLAIFYIILGVFRIISALSFKMLRSGWTLFNGIIGLLLGILILAQWPASGLFIIGLFVGIDLLFCGWAYIMAALGGRAMMKGK